MARQPTLPVGSAMAQGAPEKRPEALAGGSGLHAGVGPLGLTVCLQVASGFPLSA